MKEITDPSKKWKFNFPKAKIIDKIPFFQEICKGKTVLHLGCTDHLELIDFRISQDKHVHYEVLKTASQIHGIDLNKESIDYLHKKYGMNNLFEYDITSSEKPDYLLDTYDIVIIPEILEHIENVKDFLLGVKKFLNEKSLLIISVPNVHRLNNFLTVLRGYEMVNPDHVNYYSYMTLKGLLEKLEFSINEWYIYIYGVSHRPFLKYGVRWFQSIVKSILIEITPWFGDGIVVVAKKK